MARRLSLLEPIQVDEATVLDPGRRQYDGDRILAELGRRYPKETRPHRFMVGLTTRDLFGPNTNYVFSWQNPGAGLGVVSAFRFLAGLDDFYERDVIATRRLAIQFISTTGSILGFTRPTRPDCAMAYPNDFKEFLQKSSNLCDSTAQQRDELLKRMGESARPFEPSRRQAILEVYRTYQLE